MFKAVAEKNLLVDSDPWISTDFVNSTFIQNLLISFHYSIYIPFQICYDI
jgi:hypothetical protein